jgi:hypothetical protein
MYAQMQQANPQVFADMAPDKLAILQSRMQRLGVMSQQYGENVQIGRQGGRAALPQAAARPGAQAMSIPGMPGGPAMPMPGMPAMGGRP